MTRTISPGGGCFGLSWARDFYEASIWDLQTHENIGRVSTDASGTSYMPALIVPVPIMRACRRRPAAAWQTSSSSFRARAERR